jgi:Uma2 family endonuclease
MEPERGFAQLALIGYDCGHAYIPYNSLESVIEQNKEGYYLALRRTQGTLRRSPMSTTSLEPCRAGYRGLRRSADEYDQLEEDGYRYELIDGVVCWVPSATPLHQHVIAQLLVRLGSWLGDHPVGEVLLGVDVFLGSGPRGGDLVYRPDLVFIRRDPAVPLPVRIVGAPQLVVEVVFESSRRMDHETKKDDYERHGVEEYWIVDPELREMTFCQLQQGRFVTLTPESGKLASRAIPGFVLDIAWLEKLLAS